MHVKNVENIEKVQLFKLGIYGPKKGHYNTIFLEIFGIIINKILS